MSNEPALYDCSINVSRCDWVGEWEQLYPMLLGQFFAYELSFGS